MLRLPAAALISAFTFTLLIPAGAAVAEVGDLSALAVLESLTVAVPSTATYDRDLFVHWIDADSNGCDTRAEVLIAESVAPAVVGPGCALSGQWDSWYDGASWADPADVDVDHFVPLGEAWRSGADLWSAATRQAFANDLGFADSLFAVTDNVNQSKSDSDPAGWVPPLSDVTTQCRYVTTWMQVKYRWRLSVDSTEKLAIQNILNTNGCSSQSVTLPAQAEVAFAPTGPQRFSGGDRYDVAINISGEYAPGVPVLYIAKGTDYPDALSAAPAAAAGGGPLLLTPSAQLLPKIQAEIERLQPQKIVVVGGEASVTPEVFANLQTLAPTVDRVGGATRYDASRALVQYAFGETGATRIYLATGAKFPDALSASAAAGSRGAAVLLVNGGDSTLDQATTALIQQMNPGDAIIAGGPNSVSTGIAAALTSLDLPGGTQRLGGADRFEAGRNINREAFASASTVFLATGLNFPDALAGAALAGKLHAPLYIVPGNCVPYNVVNDINAFNPVQINILGGPNSVGAAVETLTPCVTTPSFGVSYSCSSGAAVSANNPNPFSITINLGLDYNRDGAIDSGGDRELPAQSSQRFSMGTINEDTSADVRATFRGSLIFQNTIGVNCVTPPPPPPSGGGGGVPPRPADVNCSDFRTQTAAQNFYNYWFPYYGDFAKLDGNDNDGRVCESLPG